MIKVDKKTTIKFSMLFLAIFIGFLSVEAFTRVMVNYKNKKAILGFYQSDQYIAQSLKPNAQGVLQSRTKGEFSVSIKTTDQGFRDIRSYEIPKPNNTMRILMLGDSFTLGHGVEVEETFAKVLERELNNNFPNTHFEVINAAYASGFTWDEAYLFTKVKGLSFEPNLVIENIWVGNDLKELGEHEYPKLDGDNLPEKIISNRTFVTEDGYLMPLNISKKRRITGPAAVANEIICDHSQFCSVILRPFIDRTIKNLKNNAVEEKPASLYVDFLLKDLNPENQKNWEIGKKMLLGMKKILKDNQKDFLIVNIPPKEQIYDPYGILKDTSIDDKRLENFVGSNNISYCDVLSKLQQKPDEVYFPTDSHLNTLGHKLTAEAIQNCIISFGFLSLESQSMVPSSRVRTSKY